MRTLLTTALLAAVMGVGSAGHAYSNAWIFCMNKCIVAPEDGPICDSICTAKTTKQKSRASKSNVDYDALARASAQLSRGLSRAPDPATPPPKQTDYLCFNQCTGDGHQWDFCHSKCDY